MKILYIDPVFGISGDMMISALLDAGMPLEVLRKTLQSIPLSLPSITPVRKQQGIIEGVHLDIAHSHLHLSIADMERFMDAADAPPEVKEDAKAMLGIILDAEAKVHGTSRDEVHLHELAHVDTLIDLLGVATGIRYFGIDKVFSGPVPHGRGFIKIAHGVVPNPPPVTLEILSDFPVVFLDESLEMTTPTGATIVRHYVTDRKAPPMVIQKRGCGVGSYKSERPDVLRIFIGTVEEPVHNEEIWMIEVDLDDMNMEYLGAVADRIREAGARDVLYFPVQMKKGRIGVRLSVSAAEQDLSRLINIIFSETTTFGLRLRKELRNTLQREEKVAQTLYGPVRVKKGYDRSGRFVKEHVEFDDVRRIADERNLPYRLVLDRLQRELKEEEK